MTFSVVWSVAAVRDFNVTLAAAADPALIRAAAARIDFMLRRMADSRSPGFRVWYEDVLGVFYRIDEEAMRVEVLFAGPSRRH